MNRLLVVIATYNEIENLPSLLDQLIQYLPSADFLVIDDDSPDGTGCWCDQFSAQRPQLQVIHRPRKSGLGSATKLGLQHAIRQGYSHVATLDADFSHAPEDLLRLWQRMTDENRPAADVVIGSRYVAQGKIEGWPWHRRVASGIMNTAVRWLLGVRARDSSGALRIYRTDCLRTLDWGHLRCNGYFYLEELLYVLQRRKAKLVELPITFRNRTQGQSKINFRELLAAAGHFLRLWVRQWRVGLAIVLALLAADAGYAGFVAIQVARWHSQQTWNSAGVMEGCDAYEVGQGSTALLFIHGYNENAYTWRKLAPELAKRVYDCRVMRLPGFGESIQAYGQYSRQDWLDAVNQELTALRKTHQRVVIVAHSLGGAVAIAVDQRSPGAIDSLVLLAPAIEVSNQRSPIFPTRFWFGLSRAFLFTRTFQMPFGNDALDPAEAGDQRRQPFTPRCVIAQLFELVDGNRGHAATHQTPSLWFVSQSDPIVDPQASRQYFDDWGSPEKQWHWVQPAGHSLPYDYGWQSIADQIDQFLKNQQAVASDGPNP